MEQTELYQLIKSGSPASLVRALDVISGMTEDEVRLRSEDDKSSFLHLIVNVTPDVVKMHGTLLDFVPVIYGLAIKGINMNAQNKHGNTCLHLACIRPAAEPLCQHFIRIGVDPAIMNQKKCRVIHTYRGHRCQIVKGQAIAKSGIWNAVEKEDMESVQRLLKTWCRVNVKKNKRLTDVADETSNVQLSKILHKFEKTNEIAIAAFACDGEMVRELAKGGGYDVNQHDESCLPPKPLVVAVGELGEVTSGVLKALHDIGYSASGYYAQVEMSESAFESTPFYQKVAAGTDESLAEAIDLLSVGSVDINLTSHQPNSNGWSYLHLVVDKYTEMKSEHEERARVLIRIIYRLALAGIDVNLRDKAGYTALTRAAIDLDQNLMTHLLRIGCDPSYKAPDGRTVNEEVYEDKGKLVFDKKYRHADLPGLWVAIDSDDISKVERWLKSWARVNTSKGDRRMIDIARAMKRKEIVQLLEEYEHINEFVCATFAGDLKAMMHLLALGKGKHKVNTIDEFFHVGYTWDRHAEFMPRPIIINAMEICNAPVVDFLLNFGADLSNVYEQSAPCGPVAFWAFSDHVDNANALVVARHADVTLRDELGCSMLHKAIAKNRADGKVEIVQTLLDRGVDVASRDHEGSTARDYIDIYGVPDADVIRQTIDSHVLDLVANDQHYKIETLLLDGYDHITDITHGNKKHTSAREIAELKELKEMIILFDDFKSYKNQIDLLHEAAKKGDLMTVSKLAGEKRFAWSKDLSGRTLLHNAVLYEHPEICQFLIDQHPNLINSIDNLMRTPLHYCVCLKERQHIWPILQDGGADPNLIDANNLSVYDYVRELETSTPIKERPRGRRVRAYMPEALIDSERGFDYGAKAKLYVMFRALMKAIPTASLSDVIEMTSDFKGSFAKDGVDSELLKISIDNKKEDVVKHLVEKCGARHDVNLQSESGDVLAANYANRKGLKSLGEFLQTYKPEP